MFNNEKIRASGKRHVGLTFGFQTTAEIASGHVTGSRPHAYSAQSYQHIHPTINTFAASYLNTQGLNNSCLKSRQRRP